MKNLLKVCRMNWITDWYCVHLHLRFILKAESNSMNGSKWCLMYPVRSKWCESMDLMACAIYTYFFKGERVIVFKWLSVVHMVVCEMAIVLQSKSIKLFGDAANGSNISLTTDHMCLPHSMDFGCIQWSRCRKCFWLVSVASVDSPSV